MSSTMYDGGDNDLAPAPHFDHELEANVLGWLTTEPDNPDYELIYDQLRTDHLDHHSHRVIYGEILAMRAAGEPVDFFTLRARLKDSALMGYGPEFEVDQLEFSQMKSRAEHVGHLPAHVALIIRLWRKRRYFEVAGKLAAAAHAGQEDLIPALMKRIEEVMTEGAEDPHSNARREPFHFLSDDECEQMPPARGLVGNILSEDSIAFLYAREGRWKTFLALDWALCLATNTPWHGRPVIGGPVAYVCAEGARGIGKRIRAWKRHHSVNGSVPLRVLPVPVQLLDTSQVRELIAQIEKQVGKPVLIVVDTLARSMAGGNENDTKDINAVTDAAYMIRAAFGCCVLVLHHSGKDEGRGMRGSSALRGNADTVMRLVSANEQDPLIRPGDPITLKSEKPKDFDPFEDISLTTQLVKWATDDGETLSSLVIVPGDPTAAIQQHSKLTATQQNALDTLYVHTTGLRAVEWEKASGLAHRTFYDARDALVARSYVNEAEKTYRVSETGCKQVSAEVQKQCDRTADGDNRSAGMPDAAQDEIPGFMGARISAAGAVPIGGPHFRTNNHSSDAETVAARIRRYLSQGMTGAQAEERALADIKLEVG